MSYTNNLKYQKYLTIVDKMIKKLILFQDQANFNKKYPYNEYILISFCFLHKKLYF